MGRLIFLIFLIVPLIEIGLFIVMGQAIGLWPTLLGVVVTALIGSYLVRRQGLGLLFEGRGLINSGQLPARQLAEGLMVAVAGALLLTPGYFTDLCGFVLLAPPVRAMIYDYLKTRMVITSVTTQTRTHGPSRPADIIDLDDDDWTQR